MPLPYTPRKGGGGTSRPRLYSLGSGSGSGSGSDYTSPETFAAGGDSEASRLATRRSELAAGKKKRGGGSGKIGPKEETAQAVVQLLASDSKESRDKGRKILSENIGDITPGLAAQYFSQGRYKDAYEQARSGKDERKGIAGILFGRDKNSSLVNRAMHIPAAVVTHSGAPQVLEGMNRVSHASMETVQAAQEGISGKPSLDSNATPATQKFYDNASGAKDILNALRGKDTFDPTKGETGQSLEYANALGVDLSTVRNSSLRRIGSVASFTGSAALDPTNLVGGGEGKLAAKVGQDAIARVIAKDAAEAVGREAVSQVAVAEAKQQIVKLGAKKASSKAQREAAASLLRSEGKTASRRFARGDAADRFISAAVNQDQGGLRVGYRSVLRKDSAPVRSFLKDTTEVIPEAERIASLMGRAGQKASTLEQKIAKKTGSIGLQRQVSEDLSLVEDLGPAGRKRLAKANKLIAERTAEVEDLRSTLDVLKGDIASGSPERLVANSPELANITERAVRTEKGAISTVLDKTGARRTTDWASKHLVPFSGVAKSKTLLDAPAVRDTLRTAKSVTTSGKVQHDEWVFKRIQAARTAAGGMDDAEVAKIRDALDIGGSVEDTASALRSAGEEGKAKYLEELDAIRRDDNAMLIEEGLADETKLRSIDDYLPRKYTKRGLQALKDTGYITEAELRSGKVTEASIKGRQGGNLERRTDMVNAPISELEAVRGGEMRDKGALTSALLPGRTKDNLLEHSPAVLTAGRSRQISAAKAQVKFVEQVAEEQKGIFGEELVRRTGPHMSPEDIQRVGSESQKTGMVAINFGESGTVWAHPDIAPELENVLGTMGTDAGIAEVANMWDKWNKTWATYATTPVIGGTSFTARNAQGNVFLAVLSGLKNPLRFVEAAKLQNVAYRAERAAPGLPLREALEAADTSADDIEKIMGAYDNGVIREGFAQHELGQGETSVLHEATGRRTYKRVKPNSVTDNVLTRSGKAMNSAVEDNARLAVYLDQMAKQGDSALASAHVKKYMFDYSELTPLESKYLKRINKFYTFARKATPLVFEEMAQAPARFAAINKASNAVLGKQDDGTYDLPDYLASGENGNISGTLASLLGVAPGDAVVGGFDTPLSAADKTVSPILDILRGDTKKAAQDTIGLTSGGPVEAIKTIAEEAGGGSLFTGSSIMDQYGQRKKDGRLRIADSILPIASKVARLYNSRDAIPGGKEPSAKDKANLLKAIVGINAQIVTTDQQKSVQEGRVRDLKDMIEKLKADGVDVPTIAELRAIGVLPRTASNRLKGG